MYPHFGPYFAINRLNRLVYPTQAEQPLKLPEECHTICGRNKDIQGLECGFQFFNGTIVLSSALSMKPTSSWCGRWTQCSHLPTCGKKRFSIFSLVEVIDGRPRAFSPVVRPRFTDTRTRSDYPDVASARMYCNVLYNLLTCQWLSYRDTAHTGGHDQVQNYRHFKSL